MKYYSSGMYVRLGFAVAVNVDPDILLIDEVLAVGDEAFQRKCLDRVRQFQREGRTIVVVTHAADLVRQICDRAAVLDHGNMVACGAPGEAVRSYREHLLRRQRYDEAERLAGAEPTEEGDHPETDDSSVIVLSQEPKKTFQVRIRSVRFEYPECANRPYLTSGDPLTIHVGYETVRPVDDLVIGVAVYDMEGRALFGWNTDVMGVDLGRVEGSGEISFNIRALPLLDGTYPVTVGMHSHDSAVIYDWREQEERFEVMSPTARRGRPPAPGRHHGRAGELRGRGGRGVSDAPAVDTSRLMSEIEDEVRRRRLSGELDAFERELDQAFARLAPVDAVAADFDTIVATIERSAVLDTRPPTTSSRPGVAALKQGVAKASGFYIRHVATQVSGLMQGVGRALRLLDERLAAVEEQAPATRRALWQRLQGSRSATVACPEEWRDLVIRATAAAPGRVLHVHAGDGRLVAGMLDGGVDAYGVEPDEELAMLASDRAPDIRVDTAAGHLAALPEASLGGVVLSGFVEHVGVGELMDLAGLALSRLSPGCAVVVISAHPASWARSAPRAGARPGAGEATAPGELGGDPRRAALLGHRGPRTARVGLLRRERRPGRLRRRVTAVHQFVPTFASRSAIGHHVRQTAKTIRSLGLSSVTYVGAAQGAEKGEVRSWRRFRGARTGEPTWLLYQLSTGSPMSRGTSHAARNRS